VKTIRLQHCGLCGPSKVWPDPRTSQGRRAAGTIQLLESATKEHPMTKQSKPFGSDFGPDEARFRRRQRDCVKAAE
jgi:hypothetical protein